MTLADFAAALLRAELTTLDDLMLAYGCARREADAARENMLDGIVADALAAGIMEADVQRITADVQYRVWYTAEGVARQTESPAF